MQTNNMKAVREALDAIRVAAMSDYVWDADYLIETCNAALAALAATERNCDEMREAIDYLCERLAELDATFDPNDVPCLRAALAAPLRNCDVGTAEEQFERWETFCMKYDNNCTGCPLNGYTHPTAYCCTIWAQMPYEEGGAK